MSSYSTSIEARSITPVWQVVALWTLVTIPALWGFLATLSKAVRLFTG